MAAIFCWHNLYHRWAFDPGLCCACSYKLLTLTHAVKYANQLISLPMWWNPKSIFRLHSCGSGWSDGLTERLAATSVAFFPEYLDYWPVWHVLWKIVLTGKSSPTLIFQSLFQVGAIDEHGNAPYVNCDPHLPLFTLYSRQTQTIDTRMLLSDMQASFPLKWMRCTSLRNESRWAKLSWFDIYLCIFPHFPFPWAGELSLCIQL